MSKQVSTLTKNIKVSDELAARLAKHGGFHTTYSDILLALLDYFESRNPGSRVTDEKTMKKERK
jgi:hypothetical protein